MFLKRSSEQPPYQPRTSAPPHRCAECMPKLTQPPTPEASFAPILTLEEVSTASPSQGGSEGSNRPATRGHDYGADNRCSHAGPAVEVGYKHRLFILGLLDTTALL